MRQVPIARNSNEHDDVAVSHSMYLSDIGNSTISQATSKPDTIYNGLIHHFITIPPPSALEMKMRCASSPSTTGMV
ncbi:hypothetical protein CDV36_016371 [Fusarium kuroshium]|uniref:Uncharacterized protein n=1 Tax=Fusarium kuroshium TaxID=2010991 RepID=A0A3M2QS65_9HYPO|nr:hypothetical protein CDV36_016371 [Fusarium kuroshium]